MKLKEIFNQLASGEFSQLSIGGQGAGVLVEANYPTILNHVNLGLVEMYKRFNLKEGGVVVELQPGQVTYPLMSIHGEASRRSKEPVRYIKDAGHPFLDDIIKIERVLTDSGVELELNNWASALSCRTPTMTTLVVPELVVSPTSLTPEWAKTQRLTVVYRAAHPVLSIPIGLFDPSRVEIELPYSHLSALLFYVASRVHNPIGMVNEFNAGNNYYAKFLAACTDLENQGLQTDRGGQVSRLQRNGWV